VPLAFLSLANPQGWRRVAGNGPVGLSRRPGGRWRGQGGCREHFVRS